MSATIRIDPDVYKRLLEVVHAIEEQRGARVSMSEAVALILDHYTDYR